MVRSSRIEPTSGFPGSTRTPADLFRHTVHMRTRGCVGTVRHVPYTFIVDSVSLRAVRPPQTHGRHSPDVQS
jgi:hypothetical protein